MGIRGIYGFLRKLGIGVESDTIPQDLINQSEVIYVDVFAMEYPKLLQLFRGSTPGTDRFTASVHAFMSYLLETYVGELGLPIDRTLFILDGGITAAKYATKLQRVVRGAKKRRKQVNA